MAKAPRRQDELGIRQPYGATFRAFGIRPDEVPHWTVEHWSVLGVMDRRIVATPAQIAADLGRDAVRVRQVMDDLVASDTLSRNPAKWID
jgi:hypothetical protein